jgi:hypothetical protein
MFPIILRGQQIILWDTISRDVIWPSEDKDDLRLR